MVPITSLWLPIVLSAVVVFLASFVLHMVLTYHRSDYRGLPDEAAALDALGKQSLARGTYVFPYAASPAACKAPDFIAKRTKGPVGILTIVPSGPPTMGASLAQWFVFCLLIGLFAAYLTGRALPAGSEYLTVFRFAGTTAFLGYGVGELVSSIWKGQTWGATFKMVFDGLLYALLTAGVFGWLWPR